MDELKRWGASLAPMGKPLLSSSKFVKVFMQGEAFGRKIDLALHSDYESLSLTLKRLGSNYYLSPFHANGLAEDDGALEDNEFIILYDNFDGDHFFLGEVPWELFTISVRRIYLVPAEKEDDFEDYLEDEGGFNGTENAEVEDGDNNVAATDEEPGEVGYEAPTDVDADADRDGALADDGVNAAYGDGSFADDGLVNAADTYGGVADDGHVGADYTDED